MQWHAKPNAAQKEEKGDQQRTQVTGNQLK